ncbi:hypothetical protein CEXT_745761 [Caerostris extrusa]|uniref:Uncharacterized protein n=1 Tax=Caerostris extrusa TaxID=172846 RepID=A0AAV4TMR7_CAEEX|nr:hypothetical protein CEXT_745761 [Caerostris extrusa]
MWMGTFTVYIIILDLCFIPEIAVRTKTQFDSRTWMRKSIPRATLTSDEVLAVVTYEKFLRVQLKNLKNFPDLRFVELGGLMTE